MKKRKKKYHQTASPLWTRVRKQECVKVAESASKGGEVET